MSVDDLQPSRAAPENVEISKKEEKRKMNGDEALCSDPRDCSFIIVKQIV